MGTKSCKAIISILLLLVTAQFTFGINGASARQNKDIILVLDTSLSMVGQAGGQNILDRVKKSISDYISQVEDGDRVTFITFDVDTRIFPTVLVDDENDRDILKKYITMTQATGLWTYTYKMILNVIETANKLEKEKDGRQTEIVIMTDAIDDPPPGDSKKFDVKQLVSKYGKKADWWIYVLSFTNLKNSDAVKQRLGKDLGLITDNVKIIETGEPEKGKRELIEHERMREAQGRNIIIPIIIARRGNIADPGDPLLRETALGAEGSRHAGVLEQRGDRALYPALRPGAQAFPRSPGRKGAGLPVEYQGHYHQEAVCHQGDSPRGRHQDADHRQRERCRGNGEPPSLTGFCSTATFLR